MVQNPRGVNDGAKWDRELLKFAFFSRCCLDERRQGSDLAGIGIDYFHCRGWFAGRCVGLATAAPGPGGDDRSRRSSHVHVVGEPIEQDTCMRGLTPAGQVAQILQDKNFGA